MSVSGGSCLCFVSTGTAHPKTSASHPNLQLIPRYLQCQIERNDFLLLCIQSHLAGRIRFFGDDFLRINHDQPISIPQNPLFKTPTNNMSFRRFHGKVKKSSLFKNKVTVPTYLDDKIRQKHCILLKKCKRDARLDGLFNPFEENKNISNLKMASSSSGPIFGFPKIANL